MKNVSRGVTISAAACVLSLVAIIVYAFVMYKLPVVFVFLIAAVVLGGLYVCSALKNNTNMAMGLIPVCSSALTAGALVGAVYLMVNQIGYVVASLDTIDTIIAFIIFEVVALAAMVLNIVSSFMPVSVTGEKEKE